MVSTKMLIGYKPVLAEPTRFHMVPPTKGKIAGGEDDLAICRGVKTEGRQTCRFKGG
jgi:hypothetical protein